MNWVERHASLSLAPNFDCLSNSSLPYCTCQSRLRFSLVLFLLPTRACVLVLIYFFGLNHSQQNRTSASFCLCFAIRGCEKTSQIHEIMKGHAHIHVLLGVAQTSLTRKVQRLFFQVTPAYKLPTVCCAGSRFYNLRCQVLHPLRR